MTISMTARAMRGQVWFRKVGLGGVESDRRDRRKVEKKENMMTTA